MSIKTRIRKLREQIQEATDAERAARVDAWFNTVSEEDLLRLADRQNAMRESTGEPQRTLTLPETAEVLGLTLEALEAQIRAAGGTP